MINIKDITRKNVLEMSPYSSARSEYKGKANIWLDANENPNETGLNRYPDPLQMSLKIEIAELRKVETERIFIGNGSDEIIDLLFRAFCEPGKSNAYIFPPTYGMYQVSAAINNIEIVEIPLNEKFELPSFEAIQTKISAPGLLFICSPNNPTGNSSSMEQINKIAANFSGVVVVDEAYIDFSERESALSLINENSNLIILQTFSKAYGLAGARIGMGFSNPEIIAVLNKIKPPYNVNTLSINAAIEVLSENDRIQLQISKIKQERELMTQRLKQLEIVKLVYPSDTNFLLVKFLNEELVFQALLKNGIVVRNRAAQIKNTLRISIGTKTENEQLIKFLKEI